MPEPTRKGRAPRRKRAPRLDPAERRARLLAHALRVFGRRGLAGGRHAEIARSARVSVPTVFVYFPTREALVAAVLDEVERFYVEMVEATLRLDLPAPELLLALARAFTASVDTEPERARLWLEWGAALRSKSWPRYGAFQEHLVEHVARIVRRGVAEGTLPADVDPEADARIIVAGGPAVVQMKLGGRPAEEVERFVMTLVRATIGRLAGSAN
ncbi:MAG TPA: TetR/AcrR family transcriptional regulator [Myxococcota bacterium]|nr:TetR/AcrR family transcriptional regulator [Myxococcota bacterium]